MLTKGSCAQNPKHPVFVRYAFTFCFLSSFSNSTYKLSASLPTPHVPAPTAIRGKEVGTSFLRPFCLSVCKFFSSITFCPLWQYLFPHQNSPLRSSRWGVGVGIYYFPKFICSYIAVNYSINFDNRSQCALSKTCNSFYGKFVVFCCIRCFTLLKVFFKP